MHRRELRLHHGFYCLGRLASSYKSGRVPLCCGIVDVNIFWKSLVLKVVEIKGFKQAEAWQFWRTREPGVFPEKA